jgi:hypothetical protein
MTHSSRKFRLPLLFFTLFVFIFILGVSWSVLAQEDVLPLPAPSGSVRAFSQLQLLTASDGVDGDQFGDQIALDGDYLLEGNFRADDDTGAAYIFERDSSGTWNEIVRLSGNDTTELDYFGQDVALQGNTAVIGAPRHTTDTDAEGAVYVFMRDVVGVWTQWQKITVPGIAAYSGFGGELAIAGNRMAIGVIGTYGAVPAVYIYQRDAALLWQHEETLYPDTYISDVAIHGETILIGLSSENSYKGGVDVYQLEAGGWVFVKKLIASDGQSNDVFGSKVMFRESQAFVSASLGNATDNHSGAVYVFSKRNNWLQSQKLVANDAAAGDRFGGDLAVDGDNLVIGSPNDNSEAGSVYLFGWNGSGWVQQDKIAAVGGRFGTSLDLQDDLLVSGAPYADNESGIVYLYSDPDLLPTATPTITHTPPPATETTTPEPAVELLVNGGFENGAAGWTIKNAVKDKVKCNKADKIFAYEGVCAWRFKASEGTKSIKLQQFAINGNSLNSGSLVLSGFVNAAGSVDSKIKVVVSYVDPSIERSKLVVSLNSETGGVYMPLSHFQPTLTTSVAAPPEKIKVQVKNSSISGKVYYDALSLTAQ